MVGDVCFFLRSCNWLRFHTLENVMKSWSQGYGRKFYVRKKVFAALKQHHTPVVTEVDGGPGWASGLCWPSSRARGNLGTACVVARQMGSFNVGWEQQCSVKRCWEQRREGASPASLLFQTREMVFSLSSPSFVVDYLTLFLWDE